MRFRQQLIAGKRKFASNFWFCIKILDRSECFKAFKTFTKTPSQVTYKKNRRLVSGTFDGVSLSPQVWFPSKINHQLVIPTNCIQRPQVFTFWTSKKVQDPPDIASPPPPRQSSTSPERAWRWCMYVCMHVCMYACMHASMHASMHACMYVRMYVCMSGV